MTDDARAVIRVEVTSEADVTRMVAAFQVLEALRDSDYEIWLVSGHGPGGGCAMRRAWRKNGLRGGSGTVNTITFTGAGDTSGTGGGAGGTGSTRIEGGAAADLPD